MFCTSGGNSASVMAMRLVCNFIFCFLILELFGAPTAFCSGAFLLSLPFLAFLPPLFPFFSPLPSPSAPLLALRGISFHFDQSWAFFPPSSYRDLNEFRGQARGGKSVKPSEATGGKKSHKYKSKSRKSKLRRSFFAAVLVLIGGDRERVKTQGPIAGTVM